MVDNLAARVARIITRYNMLAEGDTVGVAVSGGADSVVLLHLLRRLSAEIGVSLKILHVNHMLRGKESEEDEVFVRELARSLDLECLVERAKVPESNLEEEARRIRRAFFQRCRAEYDLKKVALGHTRSDQAETVLFRLLRGSGLAGLAGMRPVTEDGLIRPLLESSGAEIREWAKGEGVKWREDSSNGDLRFARNRLRNEAMPNLKSYFNSNLEGVLASTAELAQEEEAYWAQIVEPLYGAIAERTHLGSILRIGQLTTEPVALQRRVVRRALQDIRGDLRGLDKSHVDAILAICSSQHGHDRVMVPGLDALRSFNQLLLRHPRAPGAEPHNYQIKLRVDTPCHLPFQSGTIHVKGVTPEGRNCANFKKDQELPLEISYLDAQVLSSASNQMLSLCVRNWQPGDQLQRVGQRQPEKIKALFQEGRVLLWERRHWPVVMAGNEIVWVRQFGSAAKFAASAENPHRILLTYCKSGG